MLALTVIQTGVFAAESERMFISNGSVEFDGIGGKNESVTLTVLKPGMTLDDFMSETNLDMPICYREMICDETENTVLHLILESRAEYLRHI